MWLICSKEANQIVAAENVKGPEGNRMPILNTNLHLHISQLCTSSISLWHESIHSIK